MAIQYSPCASCSIPGNAAEAVRDHPGMTTSDIYRAIWHTTKSLICEQVVSKILFETSIIVRFVDSFPIVGENVTHYMHLIHACQSLRWWPRDTGHGQQLDFNNNKGSTRWQIRDFKFSHSPAQSTVFKGLAKPKYARIARLSSHPKKQQCWNHYCPQCGQFPHPRKQESDRSGPLRLYLIFGNPWCPAKHHFRRGTPADTDRFDSSSIHVRAAPSPAREGRILTSSGRGGGGNIETVRGGDS